MENSGKEERWEPIEIPQLKVGHYIRINHRWFDHPFVRRMFQISAERELEIIREVGLTRIFVDPSRSVTEQPAAAAAQPEVAEAVANLEADAEQKRAAEQAAMKAEREGLAAAQARGRVTLERAQYVLGALNLADPHGATILDEYVDFLVAILNNSTTPLSLMAAGLQGQSAQRLALLGSDAVGMAAVIGKGMGLKTPELRTLTRAAATHLLGLARIPAHLIDEEAGAPAKTPAYRNYPALSASILEQCGGFPEDVLRIVREHRERPDGQGFPQGLAGEAIHPHARIVGAIREFQIRCGSSRSPIAALAYLNKNLRGVYGTEIIGHLANALLSYPPGTHVQLSDGRVARVLRSEEAMRIYPLVQVVDGGNLGNRVTVDLSQNKELSIVRVLDTSQLPARMFETAKRTLTGGPPPAKPAAPEAATAAPEAATAAPEAATATPEAATAAPEAAPPDPKPG